MKKTLIALAALASIGSAFAADAPAAPTITPYVQLDIGLINTTKTGAADSTTVADHGYNGTHFGVKTASDLGGGLSVNAQLEEGFNSQDPANGFTGTGVSNRVAKIGITGSFGAVDVGTVWGPYDNVTQEAMNYNKFSPYGNMLNSGAHGDNGVGNSAGSTVGSIQYTTPTMSGVTATINYAPKKDATTNSDLSMAAFDVTYVAGPLNVALAYEHAPSIYENDNVSATNPNGVPAGSTAYSNAWHISGLYDLKTVLLSAAVSGATVDGVLNGAGTDKDTGYSLSAAVPMGQWTPSFGVASVKTSGDNLNQTTTAYGVQALYAWSKAATFYVGYKSAKTTFVSGAADSTATFFATGLTLSF